MTNVPNLRFKEFSGEWEGKKIRDIFSLSSGTTPSKLRSDYFNGDILWVTSGELKRKYISSTIDKISDLALKESSLNLYPIGTFVIAIYGLEASGTRGSCGILKKEATISQACMGFIPKQNVLNEFIYYWYLRHGEVIGLKYPQGTKQQNLSTELVGNLNVLLPTLQEQEKIASFFSLIDKKIELQTEKVEELKNYKKGIMQKIFSQELRFKDENGNEYPEWEECKVKDLFDVTRGVVIAKSEISDTSNDIFKYAVYSSQTSNNGILGYDQTFDFDGNYLTWTTDGANAGRVFCRSGRFRCTNVCGVLVEKNNTIGYANKLVAEILNKETPKHVSYVGNPKLMNGVMAEIKLNIPSLEEQTKIDKLINQLDIKIESEQTKLNLLDDYKKGLLQQMFI